MKRFQTILLFFGACAILAIAILNSAPAKKAMEKSLLEMIAEEGFKVESVSGNIPFHIHLKNVEIAGAHFDEVDAKINLLYLLKKELYIQSLHAVGFKLPKTRELGPEASHPTAVNKLPLTITVHAFTIQGELNLQGKGKLEKNGAGALEAMIIHGQAKIQTSLTWDAEQTGEIQISCTTPSIQAFAPWIQTEQEGALEFHAQASGSLAQFSGKIEGHFKQEITWAFASHFHTDRAKTMQFDQIKIESPLGEFAGSSGVNSNYEIQGIAGNFQVNLPKGSMDGTIVGQAAPTGLQLHLNVHTDSMVQANGSVTGLYAEQAFIGETNLAGTWLGQEWKANSSIAIRPTTSVLLENIQIESTLGKVQGALTYRLAEKDFAGKFQIEEANLSTLHQAVPTLPDLEGVGAGTIWFDKSGWYADITADQVYYDSLFAQSATMVKAPNEVKLTLENARWKALSLSSANGSLIQNEISFNASGTIDEPFEVQMKGTLDQNQFTLLEFKGTLAEEPFALNQPATLNWSADSFQCTPLAIKIGEGSLYFEGSQSRKKTDLVLNANQLSLKNFSLNTLEVPFTGQLSFTGTFHEENGLSHGQIFGKIDQGILAVKGSPESLAISGFLEANLEGNHLKGKSNVTLNQKPFVAFDFDIPLSIDPHRRTIHPHLDRNVEATLAIHGRLEEALDIINFGTHRIEGNIDCDFKLSGKMNRPQLLGSCQISDGRYQNYLTGTDLIDLQGNLRATGKQLFLENLSARDAQQGTMQATGSMDLSVTDNFPFRGSLECTDLEILQLDLITTKAAGKLDLKGDLKGATLTGTAEITTSDIVIPDKLSRSFPDLKVVYKNAPNRISTKIQHKVQKARAPYPLRLDLKVTSPKGILIHGRGIQSEWKGDFAIGGLYTNPSVDGKLELIQGEFVFAGKYFKLLDGSIAMQGNAYEMPLIDISANTSEKGISITARIKGPVNTPQLTFQSSPPLPLSGIVAYLIFGKDLSEVSGIQALQLASTVASLAGEGPDILEMTRKTLGVDRLQIVMTPQSLDPGADTVALEVGKVIFPGFLVTLRQGAEEDSTNIGIEVDLTHGFTLGLESQQLPEQGKFSLNWNINY